MSPISKLLDADLIALVKSGSEDAFAEIFNRYHDPICRFLKKYLHSKELAEDICQNVFAKFWEHREESIIIRELSAWLFTIAKRQALDFLRRASVEQNAMGTILANYPVNNSAEEDYISKDYFAFIDQVVSDLPEQTKIIFQLCRQQHKSYDEVAIQLGISRHTVKKHMVRSMKVLKDAAQIELGIQFCVILVILSTKA